MISRSLILGLACLLSPGLTAPVHRNAFYTVNEVQVPAR